MTAGPATPQRPRCPVKGCAVRYRGGPDRLCAEHQHDHELSGVLAAYDTHKAAWPPVGTTPGGPR